VHLLSVFGVTGGHARAQREVDSKTNEIPELEHVTAGLDLTGTVLTLDALQPQGPARRCHASRLGTPVPVRFPPELLEQARRAADADDRSLSAWIRRAVEHELRRTA